MQKADVRNPLGETLANRQLVIEVPWPVNWTESERTRVSQYISYPPLLAAVQAGISPTVWVVAGPALETRLREAETDDEHPARYALLRTVLDWYRTGIAQPIPKAVAISLLGAYLPLQPTSGDIEDALEWAMEAVLGAARTTSQSLLAETREKNALVVNDYIQDADARAARDALARRTIPVQVLTEALAHASSAGARYKIGQSAERHGHPEIASRAFEPLARGSDLPTPESRRWTGGSPYRGLLPFTESDADIFYGRERLTAALAGQLSARLTEGGLLIVTGASGSGKSSLLRAGLLSALSRGTLIQGSERWPRVLITPTQHPLRELGVHLGTLAGSDAQTVQRSLVHDPAQAQLAVRQAITTHSVGSGGDNPATSNEDTRLILIVNQFEQVFTQVSGEAERLAFIRALHAAATRPPGTRDYPPALVVIAVRGDFWDRCTAYPELSGALHQGQFVVGPMTDSDLRRAITGPADTAGLQIDPALTDTILNDLRATGTESPVGVLPLLSQAMQLTWENREGSRLTVRGYGRTGGLSRAIQKNADNVFDSLQPGQKLLARQILRAMTATSADGRHTRRPVTRAELHSVRPDADSSQIDTILEQFAAKGLIILDADTALIVHDSVLEAWHLLRDWLEDDRASWILYSQLTDESTAWQNAAHDPSFLYRGAQLVALQQAATSWSAKPDRFPALSRTQMDFLQASTRAERRGARTRRAFVAALLVLTLTALTTSALAFRERTVAIHQSGAALSRQLAAESQALGAKDPVMASLLAAAAWKISPTNEAQRAMVNAISQADHSVLRAGAGSAAVAFSPDGKLLATASADGGARLWDVASHRPASPPLAPGSPGVTAVAFSPDGKLLATASADGGARLWDVASHRPASPPLAPGSPGVTAVAFSPDGKLLATASADGGARLWDVASHRPASPPLAPGSPGVTAVAFSPDGKLLATASADGGARLWDVASHRPASPPLAPGSPGVTAVAFSPDGKLLATASADGGARLWDVASHRPASPPLAPGSPGVTAVAFSPDGKLLATASADGGARLWDVASHRPASPPLAPGSPGVTAVAFSPDGKLLATASADGGARLWDVATLQAGKLLSRVCAIAGRPFTRSEWARYVQAEPFQRICP